jgi:hypothetical protein
MSKGKGRLLDLVQLYKASRMNMNRSVFTRIPITRYGTQRAVHSG